MQPPAEAKKITIFNGSLGGRKGNTGAVTARFTEAIARCDRSLVVDEIALREVASWGNRECARFVDSDAYVFATGTYWDSWGSPLQSFLEQVTGLEAGPTWLGKPAAVLVTMHSVGGKEIVSRLQGVLSSLGLRIPPLGGMAYSLAGHFALRGPHNDFLDDLWKLDDLEIVAHNFVEAVQGRAGWRAWPVDRTDPTRLWLERADR